VNRYAEQLEAHGMSRPEAQQKGELFERAARALHSPSAADESLAAFYVPGRIEVLGKHTDYAGGRSLLCAVELGFCLVARKREDALVNVINARTQARCALALDLEPSPGEQHWCNYPSVAMRRLARNFPFARRGADIAFVSDLPAASGMSSSSALIVAVFLALADINAIRECDAYRREIHCREDFAGYLGSVENGQSFGALTGDRGVGTFGGSEDHTAILCSRAGELRQYSFCPIRHERTVALPKGLVFVVAVSGVVAMKTGAVQQKYNQAALAARKILDLWCAATGRNDPTLAAALDHASDAAGRIREILRTSRSEEFPVRLLCERFEQFLAESTVIIPAATDSLSAGDLPRFGTLVDQSQLQAENLLHNQVPETIALARSARSLGAVAASAFGAGFGGRVWALVHADDAIEFASRWEARYQNQFPAADHSRFLTVLPGPPALRL
jgi:galactokinase